MEDTTYTVLPLVAIKIMQTTQEWFKTVDICFLTTYKNLIQTCLCF